MFSSNHCSITYLKGGMNKHLIRNMLANSKVRLMFTKTRRILSTVDRKSDILFCPKQARQTNKLFSFENVQVELNRYLSSELGLSSISMITVVDNYNLLILFIKKTILKVLCFREMMELPF